MRRIVCDAKKTRTLIFEFDHGRITMRVGILHGWMLSGSGSNVYVQNIARALHQQGHEVHVICQDRNAERFPFVSKIILHHEESQTEERVLQPEGVVVHIPDIGSTLPVFVWDKYPMFEKVVEFPKMSFGALQHYLDRNVDVIHSATQENEIEVLHANHAIMMPLIARLVSEKTATPYIVALHGSALVYAVQEDPTLFDHAVRGLDGADAVLVGNQYFKSRVIEIFAERCPTLSERIMEVPLGVDTDVFKLIKQADRMKSISTMVEDHRGEFTGRNAEQSRMIRQAVYRWIADGEIPQSVFDFVKEYSQKHPDADLRHRLYELDWNKPVILYVGRLILGKGIQDLLVAYFEVLRETECQLIVVGSGPIREWLEAFAIIRQHDISAMIEPWLDAGRNREDSGELLDAIAYWIQDRSSSQGSLPGAKIIFTGFLDHTLLQHLVPCVDVAVFPSLVPESFGLVALEAASAGVIPLVTDFSGLRDSALVFEKSIPGLNDGDLRIPLDPEVRIQAMVSKIKYALRLATESTLSETFRSTCERVYSWNAVTSSLAKIYESVKE